MKLTILYEDDAILVCHKPAGVAVQTARLGEADMESLLKNYRAEKGEEPWIGVVHRLDQPVEGVMVFAKTKEAAASLGRQMRERLAEKDYDAVTDGIPAQKKGDARGLSAPGRQDESLLRRGEDDAGCKARSALL